MNVSKYNGVETLACNSLLQITADNLSVQHCVSQADIYYISQNEIRVQYRCCIIGVGKVMDMLLIMIFLRFLFLHPGVSHAVSSHYNLDNKIIKAIAQTQSNSHNSLEKINDDKIVDKV